MWIDEIVYRAPKAQSTEQGLQGQHCVRVPRRIVSSALLVPLHAEDLPSQEESLLSGEETTPDLIGGLSRR
jgi:hypothetical protein